MTKILFILLFSISNAYSQQIEPVKHPYYKFELKPHIVPLSFKFMEGAFDGLRDAAMFNRIRNSGEYWYGRDSWQLKYKNGDPNQGEAFFGSTTFLVMFTDGAHLSNTAAHTFNILSNTWMPDMVGATRWQKFKINIGYALVRSAGHNLIYGVIFKPK